VTAQGTVHHEFHFTVEEGIDAVPQVIWHLEVGFLSGSRRSLLLTELSPQDLRCDYHSRFYAYVPAGSPHQGDGH
jgi:hypothetical protein